MQFPMSGLGKAEEMFEVRGNLHEGGGRNVGYLITVSNGAFLGRLRAVSSVAWGFMTVAGAFTL
jgi:hypothetical protein